MPNSCHIVACNSRSCEGKPPTQNLPPLARHDAAGQNKVNTFGAMLIHPRAPFNFAQTLRFILAPPALLNGRQFAPLLDYFVDGEYRRVLELGEQLILYGVREEGPRDKPRPAGPNFGGAGQ